MGLRFCTGCGAPLNTPAATQAPYVPPAPAAQPIQAVAYPTPEDSFAYTPTIPTQDNSKRNLFIGLGAGGGLLALIGIFVAITAKPEPVSVEASLTIIDQNCYNLGWGYFDIPGAQVTLTVDGVVAGYATFPRYGSPTVLGCKFTGYFSEIPADGETYSYSLASGRRGVVTRTLAEMQANDWSFDLTLG